MTLGGTQRLRRLADGATDPGLPPASRRRGDLWRRIKAARWSYLFVLPNLLLAAGFSIYPAVASWWFSLLDWGGFTSNQVFVGLANYRELIGDPYFWGAFGRSFLFMLVAVPIQLILSLIVAIVLNDRALRLAPLFRTMFFIPVITTTSIVGIVMSFVLSPFKGPVNLALVDLGLLDRPIDFLGNSDTALWTVIGVYVWKSLGLTMIYWLAALQVVPAEIHEAARVDGAGWWRMHTRITLPLIQPFALIITLIGAIAALNVFPLIQTMTGGGPFFATEVMEVYIYRTAFGGEGMGASRLGYASAAGVWFGVCVMVIALVQGAAARRVRAMREELKISRDGGGER
jgi:multiple sugar transport system permease protein